MTTNREFKVHTLNEGGIDKAKNIASIFDTTLEQLKEAIPGESREMSICKTKLEEACFFAKKAMASQVENQKEAA